MKRPVPGQKPTLGSMLRTLRLRSGLTLKEMSLKTGLSFSTLSKVEHDRLSLTYDKLEKISESLNIRLSEFLAELEAPSPAIVTGRHSITTPETALHLPTTVYDNFYYSAGLRNKQMIPTVFHLKAKSIEEFGPLLQHSGEEFIYVLEGAIEVHTEFYDPMRLEKGHGVYMDSRMGHGYTIAEGCDAAIALSVTSSPHEEVMESRGPRVEPHPAPPRRSKAVAAAPKSRQAPRRREQSS